MKNLFFIVLFIISNYCFGQKNMPVNSHKLIAESDRLLTENKLAEALELLQKIDYNDTNYVNVLKKKSQLYIQMEKYKECIQVCEEGININKGGNYVFLINAAVSNLRTKNFEESIKFIEKGLVEYPHSFLLYFNKGAYFESIRNYEEAIKYYQKSIQINPFYSNSHLNLGTLAYKQ